MHTLLSNDVEQVNQLYQFIAAMKRYHEEVGNPGPGFPDSVCFFFISMYFSLRLRWNQF